MNLYSSKNCKILSNYKTREIKISIFQEADFNKKKTKSNFSSLMHDARQGQRYIT